MIYEHLKPIQLRHAVQWLDMPNGKNGCWTWTRYKNHSGYAVMLVDVPGHWRRSARMLHRIMYEMIKGEIPKGLVLDHLCRNRACCNPAHLEPVTNRVNLLRGVGKAAENAAKTHCKYGHPFDDENTSFQYMPNGNIRRRCLRCIKETNDSYVPAHKRGFRKR